MKKMEFITKIWDYYLMLEKQFIDTFEYVEPVDSNEDNKLNLNTFSKKYNQLLLSIGSEADILLKELCKKISKKTVKTMESYRKILKEYKNFPMQGCQFVYDSEPIFPWLNFKTDKSPTWWTDYNRLKHNRLEKKNFVLGNYNNVKIALAGLFVLCRVLHREYFEYEPFKASTIFKMHNWTVYYMVNEDDYGFYNDPENPDPIYQ